MIVFLFLTLLICSKFLIISTYDKRDELLRSETRSLYVQSHNFSYASFCLIINVNLFNSLMLRITGKIESFIDTLMIAIQLSREKIFFISVDKHKLIIVTEYPFQNVIT